MNGIYKLQLTTVLLALLVLVGCAKAPTAEIEAAGQTMDQARAAGAGEYAADSLKAAEDARALLDTELKAQEERFALVRSYDKASELAAAAKAAAQQAEQDAIEGRNRAREEAATLIAEVRASLTEVKNLLDRAPSGKGTAVDLAAMRADLSAIEESLTQVDSDFAAERYLESKTGAQVARDKARSIESEILRAMEASQKRPTRRS